jgi:hypothetical protein
MTKLGQITSGLVIGFLQHTGSIGSGENAVTITLSVPCGQVDLTEMGIQLMAAVVSACVEKGGSLLDPEARQMVEFDE